MKMKLTKNKKYLQQKFSRKVLVPHTTADFTSRVIKCYVPFTCKFPMVMLFMSILHRWCRSKTNFYVFSYDKASLKFWASFIFFLAVFVEKFQKIHYQNYVRRGIIHVPSTEASFPSDVVRMHYTCIITDTDLTRVPSTEASFPSDVVTSPSCRCKGKTAITIAMNLIYIKCWLFKFPLWYTWSMRSYMSSLLLNSFFLPHLPPRHSSLS